MTPAPARDLLPVVPVALVAGGAMAAVVATSLGLMPLYGQPEPGTAGWQQVAPDLGPAVRETLLLALGATVVALVVGMGLALVLLAGAPLVRAAALAVLAVPTACSTPPDTLSSLSLLAKISPSTSAYRQRCRRARSAIASPVSRYPILPSPTKSARTAATSWNG